MDQSQHLRQIAQRENGKLVNLELDVEHLLDDDDVKIAPEKFQTITPIQKTYPQLIPQTQKLKMPYITFDEIKKLQDLYFAQLKTRGSIGHGDNSRSAGFFIWTPTESSFTANKKTGQKQDGLININGRQKFINVPVLPQQNQSILQIEFKLKRGEELEIRSIGVDKRIIKKLIFSIFHTGYSLKFRIIVPYEAKLMKIWKEIELPLKYNQNHNMTFSLKQSITGKQVACLNGVQVGVNLKIPSIPLYYYGIEGGTLEKVTLEQVPIEESEQYGKCETNCSLF